MADSIDVALAGPRVYHGAPTDDPFVNETGRKNIGAGEVRSAVRVLWRAWAALLAITLVVALL